jgi:hypothetical protein
MKNYVHAIRCNFKRMQTLAICGVVGFIALFGAVMFGCALADAGRAVFADRLAFEVSNGPMVGLFVTVVGSWALGAAISGYVLWHTARNFWAGFHELAREWWETPLEERVARLSYTPRSRRPHCRLDAGETEPVGDYW